MDFAQGPGQPSRPLPPVRRNRVSRRTLLAAASGLAAPFLPRFARAAEITWRIGHGMPADFALHVQLTEAAGSIGRLSGGQMAVEIHPNNELGTPVGLMAQVRAGTIDAAPLSGQLLARDLPAAALPMQGFAFAGYDQLWPAIDGDLGGYIRGQMTRHLGLVAMERCWDFGFHQITTSGRQVNVAADIEGLRLRTQPDADFVELFRALKAVPVMLPVTKIEQSLGSRIIDGQESVLLLVKVAGLSKVQSICALTDHVWDGQWICVSGKSWAKLPPKLKDIVAAALNAGAGRQRKDIAGENAGVRKELEAGGMKFNAVDQSSFRSVLRNSGYYAARKQTIGADGWAILEKYTGRLS